MNMNVLFIGIPMVLLAIAAVAAAITFAVKAIKGRTSKVSKNGKKKQSIFILLKALRAEKAELTKALWIRFQESSYKPETKLPKGTYQIDGLMRNDKGEWLLALINDENSYLVKIADSIKFTSKSKDETDDEDDEEDDD